MALAASAGAVAQAAGPSGVASQSSPAHGTDLADEIRRYAQDRGDVASFYNITWSRAGQERRARVYDDWQRALERIDFDALSQDGKVDYLLLRNSLRNSAARAALARARLDEMTPLLPFGEIISELEERRWRVERVDPRAAAGQVSAIVDLVKRARARVEAGRNAPPATQPDAGSGANEAGWTGGADDAAGPLRVTPVLAARTASAVDELRGTLERWYDAHAQYAPEFSWWLAKPQEAAVRAMSEYSGYLRGDVAGLRGGEDEPLIGDPIGRAALLADLANEMIAYSPEELIAIGERELSWCEAQMRVAAREMGMGDDWKGALGRVKENAAAPGEQAEYCAALVREVTAFLKERELLTIPPLCAELWRIEMIGPDRQRYYPFQYYGGLHIGVAFASEHQSHADKLSALQGNNRHFTRIVVPHELIPGHHLQGFMARRFREDRGLFSTPFFVEGWCLYWELRLWELDWGRSPEDRIGMLFWRMHRAARIIVSLRFHLGQMTPPEMVDFLVERVGHERVNATSEVRRYISGDYSPLYQAGYLLGGIQLRALHREAVESGRMSERDFNDRLLTLGPIPIDLVRATILRSPLTREQAPAWRFADEGGAAP